MKTLRDEVLRIEQGVYDEGIGRPWPMEFFRRYGDWRVAEGEWETQIFGNRTCVRLRHDNGILALGYVGDHARMFLPPEEKEGTVIALTRAGADRLVAEAQARADRYKKALREIEGHPAIAAYMVLRDIARRALDEHDSV